MNYQDGYIKQCFKTPADENWADWKKHILPTEPVAAMQKKLVAKLENGKLSKDDFRTLVFYKYFYEQIIFILLSLNYIKSEQDLESADKRAEVINEIDNLIKIAYGASVDIPFFKNKKIGNTQREIGHVLYNLIALYGQFLWNIEHIKIDTPKATYHNALFGLADTIKIIKQIDDVFYHFKYKTFPAYQNSLSSAGKKRQVKDVIHGILKTGKYKRPVKNKNPIENIISEVKNQYENDSGKKFPKADKTLENWIYDYFNDPLAG